MKRIAVFVLGMVFASLVAGAVRAQPQDFTPRERNVEAMHEAIAMSVSMLGSAFGSDVTTLAHTGTFDDTGWSSILSGTYGSMPVSLSFSGTFNPGTNSGSYSSTGTVGVNSWNGSGTWSYNDTSVGRTDLIFDMQATVLGTIFDRHTLPGIITTKDCEDDALVVRDFGRYRHTIFGIPVGPVYWEQISLWVYPKDGPMRGIGIATVSLPDERKFLDGLVNLDGGLVAGTVAVVPEPAASVLLLGCGMLALGYRSRRAAVSPHILEL